VREDEYEAAAIVNLSNVIVATSSSFERESQRDLAQNEEKN
jgi:thiamine biosynthesis lipoprotein ApbE